MTDNPYHPPAASIVPAADTAAPPCRILPTRRRVQVHCRMVVAVWTVIAAILAFALYAQASSGAAWSYPAAGLAVVAICLAGSISALFRIDAVTEAMIRDNEIACRDGNLILRLRGGTRTFPLAQLKRVHCSYPVLYIVNRGLRLDDKIRVSVFEPEDVRFLVHQIGKP